MVTNNPCHYPDLCTTGAFPSSRSDGLNLAVGLWSLKNKCNNDFESQRQSMDCSSLSLPNFLHEARMSNPSPRTRAAEYSLGWSAAARNPRYSVINPIKPAKRAAVFRYSLSLVLRLRQ